MRFRRNKRHRGISIITLIPLVNVVFLLLFFFLLAMGLPLRLYEWTYPGAVSGSRDALASGPMTVVVLPERIMIDGKPVNEQTLSGLPRHRDIVILADMDIPYFKVMYVLSALRLSGHTRLSLATKAGKN